MTILKPHSVIRFDSCGQALSQRLFLEGIQYQHCMAWFMQPDPITIIFLVTPGWICGIHYYSLLSQLLMAFTIIPYTTHCKCAHSNQKFDKTNSGRLRGIPGCHGTPFQLSVLLYNYITSYFYLFLPTFAIHAYFIFRSLVSCRTATKYHILWLVTFKGVNFTYIKSS